MSSNVPWKVQKPQKLWRAVRKQVFTLNLFHNKAMSSGNSAFLIKFEIGLEMALEQFSNDSWKNLKMACTMLQLVKKSKLV